MKRINQTLYKFEDGDAALTVSGGAVSLSIGYSSITPEKARELAGICSAAACEAESQFGAKEAAIEATR